MICNRMEDYLSCHHPHPYHLYGCPAVIIGCLQFPLIMWVQRETFIFKHTGLESHINLVFCRCGSFPPHHGLVFWPQKAKHLGHEWEIQSIHTHSPHPPTATLFTLWISASIWTISWNLPFSIFCWLLCRHSHCLFWNKTNELYFLHFSIKCIVWKNKERRCFLFVMFCFFP